VRFEARNARLAAQKAEREARLAAKREALEAARRRGDHRAAIDEIIARKKTKAADGGDPEQSD
jgi:Arc/MetJ-type ribon-helix-helix transcriptional regulator